MNSDAKFGDYARVESGFAFKSVDWDVSGVPVVKIKNVKDGTVSLEGCAFVSDLVASKAWAYRVSGGDVLVSLTGYVGQVGRVSIGDTVYVNQRVGLVQPIQPSDKSFVYHLLRNLRNEVKGLGTGSAQTNVAPKDIMNLPVPRMRSDYRRTVADILDCLEEKIATNRQVSKTLEDIAQTIFKSWFIDFDPVKAKMAGEKPVGMDTATAALFPDAMEDSELGLIPKGWVTEIADNIFDISIGRTPPRREPEWFCAGDEGVPWVSIRDMGTFSTYSNLTNEGLTEEAVSNFRFPIVPEGTVLMSFKLTVGKLCISDKPLVTNEAIAHFVIHADSVITNFFTYLWLANHDMNSLDSTSSIGIATNSGVIKQIRFLMPSEVVVQAFSEICSPIFNQIKNINSQSNSLVEIRDSLLPRLISGELQIPEEMLAS